MRSYLPTCADCCWPTGAAGRQLFRRLFQMSTALVRAGLADPGADPVTRAAFLLASDLAVLLLREHLADVLGVDPLSGEGMTRWAREVLAIYAAGLLAAPAGGARAPYHDQFSVTKELGHEDGNSRSPWPGGNG